MIFVHPESPRESATPSDPITYCGAVLESEGKTMHPQWLVARHLGVCLLEGPQRVRLMLLSQVRFWNEALRHSGLIQHRSRTFATDTDTCVSHGLRLYYTQEAVT